MGHHSGLVSSELKRRRKWAPRHVVYCTVQLTGHLMIRLMATPHYKMETPNLKDLWREIIQFALRMPRPPHVTDSKYPNKLDCLHMEVHCSLILAPQILCLRNGSLMCFWVPSFLMWCWWTWPLPLLYWLLPRPMQEASMSKRNASPMVTKASVFKCPSLTLWSWRVYVYALPPSLCQVLSILLSLPPSQY